MVEGFEDGRLVIVRMEPGAAQGWGGGRVAGFINTREKK